MPTIYLVRHGSTPANREKRFAGRSGETLNSEGIEQMRRVGERLRAENIGAIYCGPAVRTVQSSQIIGSQLKIPFSPLAELDEIYIPHWDTLTKDEIRQQFGAQYPTWLSAPQSFTLPGCETLAQVQKRGVMAINRLLALEQKQNLLLVSHLIVLRCLVLYFQEFPIRDFRAIQIDNGTILRLTGPGENRMSISFLQDSDP